MSTYFGIPALALAGLLNPLGGKLPRLWVFTVIGLAVALPVMSAANLVATVNLGPATDVRVLISTDRAMYAL